MKIFLAFFLCFFASNGLFAQVTFPSGNSGSAGNADILSSINIEQDYRLREIVQWHIQKNKATSGMEGYRVEIFFSSTMDAKNRALQIKQSFLSRYPEYPVYIKYEAPNFRVRVGDFRTKNEALKLFKEIQNSYPSAFIVPDKIHFPLLKPLNYE